MTVLPFVNMFPLPSEETTDTLSKLVSDMQTIALVGGAPKLAPLARYASKLARQLRAEVERASGTKHN